MCTTHVQARRFVVATQDDRIPARTTVVDDALHCGACTVHVEGAVDQALAEVER